VSFTDKHQCTIATEYKSPETEILAFDMAVERLVHIGYPEEVRKFKYDPIFPVRGMLLLS
jgi:5'-nucleotidase